MASRAHSDLLLVGSLPADTTEGALRAAAELFGDLVFALPDGETGPRGAWVGYEREQLTRPNPDVVGEQRERARRVGRHEHGRPDLVHAWSRTEPANASSWSCQKPCSQRSTSRSGRGSML